MDQFLPKELKTGEYLKVRFHSSRGVLNFRILFPDGFEKSRKYPVFLFLHGAGERGDDNEAQLVHGSEMIKKGMDVYQSIAIFPQCPADDYWINIMNDENGKNENQAFKPDVNNPPSKALSMVMELMDRFLEEEFVDTSRIYVGGLSMGGMGTFDLCWRKPKMFAAAIAICGAGSTAKAPVFADLPIRIYHGSEDGVVAVEKSLEMNAALIEAGGSPELFIYEGVNHNSWDNAFAEPDFLSWLFSQIKS